MDESPVLSPEMRRAMARLLRDSLDRAHHHAGSSDRPVRERPSVNDTTWTDAPVVLSPEIWRAMASLLRDSLDLAHADGPVLSHDVLIDDEDSEDEEASVIFDQVQSPTSILKRKFRQAEEKGEVICLLEDDDDDDDDEARPEPSFWCATCRQANDDPTGLVCLTCTAVANNDDHAEDDLPFNQKSACGKDLPYYFRARFDVTRRHANVDEEAMMERARKLCVVCLRVSDDVCDQMCDSCHYEQVLIEHGVRLCVSCHKSTNNVWGDVCYPCAATSAIDDQADDDQAEFEWMIPRDAIRRSDIAHRYADAEEEAMIDLAHNRCVSCHKINDDVWEDVCYPCAAMSAIDEQADFEWMILNDAICRSDIANRYADAEEEAMLDLVHNRCVSCYQRCDDPSANGCVSCVAAMEFEDPAECAALVINDVIDDEDDSVVLEAVISPSGVLKRKLERAEDAGEVICLLGNDVDGEVVPTRRRRARRDAASFKFARSSSNVCVIDCDADSPHEKATNKTPSTVQQKTNAMLIPAKPSWKTTIVNEHFTDSP
jgi:hypothetical protein